MDRVDAAPSPARVRRPTRHVQNEAQGAVASALDARAGGLAENRQVRLEPVGVGHERPTEPVALADDLLVVVEDPGDIAARSGQSRGQLQAHRNTALHIDAAAPPHDRLPALPVLSARAAQVLQALEALKVLMALDTARDVVGAGRDGDGVQVAGDDDSLTTPQASAGDDGVAVPQNLQVRMRRQGGLDGVGQRGLRPGDARGRHQGEGEGAEIAVQIGQHDRRRDRGRDLAAGRRG